MPDCLWATYVSNKLHWVMALGQRDPPVVEVATVIWTLLERFHTPLQRVAKDASVVCLSVR